MTQLMQPEVNAAWNLAARSLPTGKTGLAYWDERDPYVTVIQQELLRAVARPRPSGSYTQIAGELQKAVEDVVQGVATPEEAAVRVIEERQ
jgi:hypothetical protein